MVVPFIEFLSKELTLKLSLGYTSEDFEEVLKLLSGGRVTAGQMSMNRD